ncbi:MAG: UDP-N-acetylmuramoyl-tripeptide--D-alanyl-D-alanine ligase [Bacteroidetes bacterium]|nr:UDP-N-acetylmuramoyl-tripeptide--D-alanyl-D-alanine ligase [Bacteroidota bacterium]MBS1649805.1 UDP-N-acetylmuramoyl-tripeptide--D-alanyl-D-alanine ligase [Bacteroidota bacterium]
MNIENLYKIFLKYPSVQTDTRKLKQGDIFFALKGPNFNANNFALQAIKQGAAYAVIDETIDDTNNKLIKVDNVLTTLQQLAKHHRQQFKIPLIAITGSNGKTTTKELVSTALASHYKTYTTQGNLNNHIGVPLTLLSIKQDAEMVVIEMGANHQKEIESYCSYTLPTHGIITNAGKAHLEGFGGIEGVKKGKGELFDFLRNNNGTAFINWDYNYLQEMSTGINNIITYGTHNADYIGAIKTSEPFLQVSFSKGVTINSIQTNLVGDYNLPNVLCAVAVAKYFNIPEEKIKQSIENYTPSNSRSQMIEKGSNKIILDAYNANPSSVKAAIENFAKINASNKIIMLGGMMELGETSITEHANIVHLIEQYKWKEVVLVGGNFKTTHKKFLYFNTATEAKQWLHQKHFENTYLLIKGSRSIQMEKILED